MQSEEMKPQYGAAKAAISNEGYMKILEQDKVERLKMMEQSRVDMIGFLHEIPNYLNPEGKQESWEEAKIFSKLTDYLKSENYSFDALDKILCLANEYGMAAEESGFRRGFQIAMKLCMEGLKGGVC